MTDDCLHHQNAMPPTKAPAPRRQPPLPTFQAVMRSEVGDSLAPPLGCWVNGRITYPYSRQTKSSS